MLYKKIVLIVPLLLAIITLSPQPSMAEIATRLDWIGIFPSGSTGNSKTDTITTGTNNDTHAWMYSISCNQTAPLLTTTPSLSSNCNFNLSPIPTPGAYEYRLYGNDQQTAAALISTSKTVWSPFDIQATCDTNTVTFNFPDLTGTSAVNITRTKNQEVQTSPNLKGQTTYTNTLPGYSTYIFELTATALGSTGTPTSTQNANQKASVDYNSNSCTVTMVAPPLPTPGQTNCPTTDTNANAGIRLDNGLLTVANPNNISSFQVSSGNCIFGHDATIPQFSIPTYASMKSIYYDQNKATNVDKTVLPAGTIPNLSSGTKPNELFYVTGNLTLDNTIYASGSKTSVIFVDGDLYINTDLNSNLVATANRNTTGLVFVVKGKTFVKSTVQTIDAYIIQAPIIQANGTESESYFCSAYTKDASGNIFCPSFPISAPQLTITGGLASLGTVKTPQFTRTLNNNTEPAEVVNFSPKYLIILKDVFAKTLQIWSEDN